MSEAKKDFGTIAGDFEMTGQEYAACLVMADCVSKARDERYTDKVNCFLAAYSQRHTFPCPDAKEMYAGELPGIDVETQQQERERRRALVDGMLMRAGYEPADAELNVYVANRKAAIDEFEAFLNEQDRT